MPKLNSAAPVLLGARTTTASKKVQYAALPYTVVADRILVCLMTSRETRRWIIPKGWPKRKLAPHQLAAEEAMEEAGLFGEVSPAPLGSFTYTKRMTGAPDIPCTVTVYPLLVTEQALVWPERAERTLVWLPLREAAARVDEAELAAIIIRLEHEHLRDY